MANEKNPFEAVQAMMLENLERVQGATQSYIDMVEKAMRGFPGADEDRIATFKAYVERRVAANHDFAEKLLRAKDFQEAFRIQVEYFQSQLRAVAEDASKIGSQVAGSFNRPTTGWALARFADRLYRAGRSKDRIKVENRNHPAMYRVMDAVGWPEGFLLNGVPGDPLAHWMPGAGVVHHIIRDRIGPAARLAWSAVPPKAEVLTALGLL
jgi:Phasin protein